MTKGKSHSRGARLDILKNNARQAARLERKRLRTTTQAQARQQRPGKSASNYDKQRYDGTQDRAEEES